MDAKTLIQTLGLEKLPEEGGFYRECFRSSASFISSGKRWACATDIYYLVTPEEFSGLHRVKSSHEIFNFFLGDPVEMIQIDQTGNLNQFVLGQALEKGEQLKLVVEPGIWQGTRLRKGGEWALLGCTCSPGFEFSDFEATTRAILTSQFPQHADSIKSYTQG